MADISVSLELDDGQFQRKINNAKTQVNGLGNTVKSSLGGATNDFKKISDGVSTLGARFAQLQAIVAASFAAQVISNAIQYADSIKDIADASGLAIENITGFTRAVTLNGGNAEQAQAAILRLSQSVGAAAEGSASAQRAFQQIGISLNDLATLSDQQLFDRTIQGLARIDDTSKRASLQTELLGKSLRTVNIQGVASGLDAATRASAQYSESIRIASDFNDLLDRSLIQFKLTVIDTIAPTLEFINILAELGSQSKATFDALGQLSIAGVKLTDIMFPLTASTNLFNRALKDVNQTLKDNTQAEKVGAGRGNAQLHLDLYRRQVEELDKKQQRIREVKNAEAEQLAQISNMARSYREIADIGRLENDRALQRVALEAQLAGATEAVRNSKLAGFDAETKALTQILTINGKIKETRDQISRLDPELDTGRIQALNSIIAAYQQQIGVIKETASQAEGLKRIEQERAQTLEWTRYLTEAETKARDSIRSIEEDLADLTLTNNQKRLVGVQRLIQKEKELAIEKRKSILGVEELPQSEIDAITSRVEASYDGLYSKTQQLIDQSRDFSTGWQRALNQYVEDVGDAASQAESLFGKMTSGMEDLLVDFVKTGKFEWKNFAAMMAEELLRAQIQKTMANILGSSTGGLPTTTKTNTSGSGSLLGGLFNLGKSALSSIGDLFGGLFANGGTLGAGRWGIAGERGPEIISGPATITPMAAAASTQVTYNIQAVDAASFQALVARDPGFIYAVSELGRSTTPGTRR